MRGDALCSSSELVWPLEVSRASRIYQSVVSKNRLCYMTMKMMTASPDSQVATKHVDDLGAYIREGYIPGDVQKKPEKQCGKSKTAVATNDEKGWVNVSLPNNINDRLEKENAPN